VKQEKKKKKTFMKWRLTFSAATNKLKATKSIMKNMTSLFGKLRFSTCGFPGTC
jgi:hypothetical protein